MFLSGVLFVLFLAGCWLYCLTDAVLTPASEFPGLRKTAWVAIIAVTFIAGAITWMIVRKPWRARHWQLAEATHPALNGFYRPMPADDAFLAAAALARHPATRSKNTAPAPIGPDDDPEVLRQLAERIRRER
jgi:hypothetical protein